VKGNNIDERTRVFRDLFAILVLALIPRLMLAISLPADDTVFWDQPYFHYARNLSEGRGFWMPNPYSEDVGPEQARAFRPPLFPFLWGCVYKITRGAYAPIRIAHAILGALSCALAYLAAIELTERRRVALVCGILCALYPPLIWHSVHLMTEPLFIFFSVLLVLGLLVFRRTGQIGWLILAGVAAGLGALTRSLLIGFLPIMVGWIWWIRGRRMRAFLDVLLFTGVVTAVLAPWIIRNAIVFRAFVPATTDAGHGFHVANNKNSLADPRGFWIPESWAFLKLPGEDAVGELEANHRLMRTTRGYLLQHPGIAFKLMTRRFLTLWRFYPNPRFVAPKHVLIYAFSYVPIFPFILLGLWRAHRHSWKRAQCLAIIDLLILYTTAMSVMFLAMMRYRVPLMPFLLAYAAIGMVAVWDDMKLATA